jgi:asparagine synthase (glutamine-hydrolysing)
MMLSDVPVGALVSGGIDSSLIALYASKVSNINLYTADVKGRNSELKYAQLLADTIKMPMKIHEHYPQDLIKHLVETTWHYESPIVVHPNSIPFQGVASLPKSNGIKPVLTGEGADELFLGYPRLLTKKWDKLIKLPFNVTENIYKKIPGLERYLNLSKTNHTRDLLFHPFNLETLNNLEDYNNAYRFIYNDELRKDHILSIEMIGRGLHSLLWRNDRMGMMHSLEARFPFLDESLIKFALNLPINMKIGRTNKLYNYKHPFLIDKYVVRKLAEKKLPNTLTFRKKEGFPLAGWLNLDIKNDFFKNGFLHDLLEWTDKGRKNFEENTDNYLKAKLACVETWGKIFIQNENRNKLQEKLNNYLMIKTN